MTYDFTVLPESLDAFWMPFTPQRLFKKAPRIVARADGMYYYDTENKPILDGTAGLWCVNAGHNRTRIRDAIAAQLGAMDYAPCFQMGHPVAFEAANRLCAAMPDPFNHVFFSSGGSEAVDTALKIALVYQRLRGKGTKRMLIGRERSYHGVGFGGISVGGTPYVRTSFSQLLPFVDHTVHTHDLEHNAFSKGEPAWGDHLADHLEHLIKLHDADNIAAFIMEPVAGAPGVLPPPQNYVKRIRDICTKYDILLIFDEVVTAFGRLGYMSAADHFNVVPDMILTAKGMTNGVIPMGGTFVHDRVYDVFMQGPESKIEFMHGYTYSGHPVACAAAIGMLDTIAGDALLAHARAMAVPFEAAVHSLKDKPYVVDIRNLGLLAAVQLEEAPGEDPALYARAVSYELFRRGVFIRFNGANLIISPPLVLNENHIDQMISETASVLDHVARTTR